MAIKTKDGAVGFTANELEALREMLLTLSRFNNKEHQPLTVGGQFEVFFEDKVVGCFRKSNLKLARWHFFPVEPGTENAETK